MLGIMNIFIYETVSKCRSVRDDKKDSNYKNTHSDLRFMSRHAPQADVGFRYRVR